MSVSASGDAARVLGIADYSNSGASSTAGSYMNHWNYTYDIWTEKTDDWDLSLDYQTYDTPKYETYLQSRTEYDYMYQTEIWENRSWGWSTSNNSPTGGQYRSQDVDTSYQYGAKYSYMYQTEIWTSRDWGYQLSNGSPTGGKYRSTWYTTSLEKNPVTYTTYYTSAISGYGTDVIAGSPEYITTSNVVMQCGVIQGSYYQEIWGNCDSSGAAAVIAEAQMNNDSGANWDLYSGSIGRKAVYYTSNVSGGSTTWVYNWYCVYKSEYRTGEATTSTTTTYWTTYIDSYGVSTNTTTWYKGGYEERTQDSAWEAKDTGYDSNLTVNNTAPTGWRYKDQSTYSRAIYKGTYQIRTQDSAWAHYDTGFNDDRLINNPMPTLGQKDNDGNTRIKNVQTYSRTWYKETYWTKDSSETYDTESKDGYYDKPDFKYTNNASTQYRNVQYKHVIDSITSGGISSGASNGSSQDSAFVGQSGGTITVSSSRYGSVGTVSYSAGESASSILSKLGALTASAKDGNTYSIFSSISSSGAVTHGYFGTITMSDSGNALKLLGLATDGYSDSGGTSSSENKDWDGITKSTASLSNSISLGTDDLAGLNAGTCQSRKLHCRYCYIHRRLLY